MACPVPKNSNRPTARCGNIGKHWEDWRKRPDSTPGNSRRLCGLSVRQLERVFQRRWAARLRFGWTKRGLLAAQDAALGPASQEWWQWNWLQATSHFCRKFKSQFKLTPRNSWL